MDRLGVNSSDEEYHSPDERDDVWIHHRDIGVGAFGVVKLFINQVRPSREELAV